MDEIYTAMGLMSGTSSDGVDVSIIKSDGNQEFSILIDKYFQYEEELTQTISAVNIEGTTIGQDQKTQITTIVSEQEVKLTRSVASSTSIQIDSGESYLVVLEQDGVTNQVKVNGGGSSVIVIRQSQ